MGLLPGPDMNPQCFGRALPTTERHFCPLRTLAPIKYLSSDCTTIWYIHKRCSFACSFTSFSPLCDPINIRCITAKNAQFLSYFHCNLLKIDQIAKWRIGGETACKTASFMYISYFDLIRTEILNWSQSSELANLWNWPKYRGFSAVRFLMW